MIEERLMEKGVSREEIKDFENSPRHNAKEDVFRIICNQADWETFERHGKFIKSLAEVLTEIAEENHPEFQLDKSDGRRKYLGEKKYKLLLTQTMASKMFETLRVPGKYGGYDPHTLTQLYQDTFSQEASE